MMNHFSRDRRRVLSAALLASSPFTMAPAVAEESFPTRAITVVSPYAVGGSTDAILRPILARLSEIWRQPVVLESKSGANGVIATQFAIRSPADGYTILYGSTGLIQNQIQMKPRPYDFVNDLTPVALLGLLPLTVAVPVSSPFESIEELLKAIKSDPAKFSYGSYGVGSSSHIYGVLLAEKLGVNIPHVPYRGEGPLMQDLIPARIPFSFLSAAGSLAASRASTLRILAVTGPQRLPTLPNIPTMAERGIAGFDLVGWTGIFVPRGVPAAVKAKIYSDLRKVLNEPTVRARLSDQAFIPVGLNPEGVQRLLQDDFLGWDAVIRRLGIAAAS
jgi:tripartite-type tricarboxylate transporter receptor subunit TctC